MQRLLTSALAFLSLAAVSAGGHSAAQTGASQGSAYPTPPPIGTAAPAAAPGYAPPSQSTVLSRALEAARARNLEQARAYQAGLTDPVARKVVDWALVDVFGQQLGAYELDRLVRPLEGWPRAESRESALEDATLPAGPIPYTALAGRTGAQPGAGWSDRRRSMNDALARGDAAGAYQVVAAHGMAPGGTAYAEAEAYAGWLALNKLRDVRAAEAHFTRLDAAVKSPTSKARAAYWLGLTYEQMGDAARARKFYGQGAQHTTTFYGQMAAEKAGVKQLVLEPDPALRADDRALFEADELVRAVRLLSSAGERSLVRVFALHMGQEVKSRTELALLVDALKGLGEQEVSLLAYRRGAQQGFILHERGYPLVTPPAVYGGAEAPLVLAITRQESQFDPRVRSSADARGMMQILPSTARAVAGGMGMAYQDSILWDQASNMRIGSRFLGQLVEQFGGNYPMAVAGYNAGPGRPRRWVETCGDPRLTHVDPIDFIECIPFSETRNYVMNVMANVQVYRARLNNGRGPLTLAYDLRRGGPAAYRAEAAATQPPRPAL